MVVFLLSAASKEEFARWQAHDALGDFCDIEEDEDAEYVDLRLNPERYTGYIGKSAHRVWRAIYEENCFGYSIFMLFFLAAQISLTALGLF